MKFYYTRLLKLGKHLQSNPRDTEAKEDSYIFKRLLAYMVAVVRLDACKSGLDKAGLALLDDIEQEAGINERFRREALYRAKKKRRSYTYEEEQHDGLCEKQEKQDKRMKKGETGKPKAGGKTLRRGRSRGARLSTCLCRRRPPSPRACV